MKAETESGEIITLPKECTCITHNEPHWMYMDRLDRERNRKLMTDPPTLLGCHGMAIEEQRRLTEKEANFKRLGIVRVIPEASDELTETQKRKMKKRHAAYLREIKAREEAKARASETLHEQERRRKEQRAELERESRQRL